MSTAEPVLPNAAIAAGSPPWALRLVSARTLQQCAAAPAPTTVALGRVVVQTIAAGICGSDLPFFRGRSGLTVQPANGALLPDGRPLHEIVGDVVVTGDPRFSVGDRVVGWASDGNALAGHVETAASGLRKYDRDAFAPEHAVVMQPLACVLFAMDRIPSLAGARVAVIGMGPIGLLFAHVAKARAATYVVGVDVADKGEDSARYGVDEFVRSHSRQWAEGVEPEFDVVIEAAGHQSGTLNDAISAARSDGWIYYFGVPDEHCPIDLPTLLRKNLTLSSGITLDRAAMLERAEKYLTQHPGLAED